MNLEPLKDNSKMNLIKEAGLMVGVDLENDINLSAMRVHEVSANPIPVDYGQMKILRRIILFTDNLEEAGDELTITIERRSYRMPDMNALNP